MALHDAREAGPRDQLHVGKTSQLPVPWAREGSGFTLLFEALALALCHGLPVRQSADAARQGQAAVAPH